MAGLLPVATTTNSGLLPSNRVPVSVTRNNNSVGVKITIKYPDAGSGMTLVINWSGIQTMETAIVNIMSWNVTGVSKAVVFGNSSFFSIKQLVTDRTTEIYITTSTYGILTATPLSSNRNHTIKAEAISSIPTDAESVSIITLS